MLTDQTRLIARDKRRIACVAGVKRGRERGNLGARERVGRAREKGKEPSTLLSPPSHVVSCRNSLPLPFRTLATQAKRRIELVIV